MIRTWLRTTGLRILISLGLAISLWAFVSFTQNPDSTVPFDNLPVRIENVADNLIVVNADGSPRTTQPDVDVTVLADQSTLATIQRSDLRAFVDLQGRGAGEHVVPVIVDATRTGLAQARFTPDPVNLSIRLEEVLTRTVPLEVNITGSVPFSYERGDASVTVDGEPISEVQVGGPSGRVSQVATVRASADVDRLTADYTSSRPLQAYSASDEVIDGVTILPATVDVLVPIRSNVGVKRVPVLPKITGSPGTNYVVSGITVSPQFVTLTGSSGTLEQIQSVSTLAIDLNGATRTTTYTAELERLNGAIIEDGKTISATVRVDFAAINRQFNVTLPVPIQAVNVPNGVTISLSPQIVQLELTGVSQQLASIDPTSLIGTINVRNLTPGTYTETPVFILPDGVTIVGDTPQVTVTVRAQPTATPEPTEVPTETATVPPTEAPEPTAIAPPTTPAVAPDTAATTVTEETPTVIPPTTTPPAEETPVATPAEEATAAP